MNEAFRKALKDIKSPDESVRRYAAIVIGEMRKKEGVPVLIKALYDKNIGVAEAASDGLVCIGGNETAKQVASLLALEEVNLRNFASEILEKIGEPSVKVLIELMQNRDKDVRIFSADIAGKIKSAKFINPLKKLLKDEEVNVAAIAAESLGRIGDDKVISTLMRNFDGEIWLKCSIVKSLGTLGGKKAIKALHSISHDEDDMVVFSLIKALGNVGDGKSVAFLSKMLEIENPFFTSFIIQAIEKIVDRVGDQSISRMKKSININPFFRLLNDSDKSLKISAIKMIGRFKNEKAVTYISSLLIDNDPEIRDSAKDSIIKIAPTDLSKLIYILESKDIKSEIKETIIEIIGCLKWKNGIGVLNDILQNNDVLLKRSAAVALGKIGTDTAVDSLNKLLKDPDGHIRRESAKLLGSIGNEESADEILSLLDDEYEDVRNEAAISLSMFKIDKITKKLISFCKSKNKEKRRLAIVSISQSNYPKKLGLIVDALNDTEWEIRWTALEKIFMFLFTKEISSLSKKQRETILQKLDDKSVQVRIKAASILPFIKSKQIYKITVNRLKIEEEPRVKYELIQSIGEMKYKDAVPTLLSLLNEDDFICIASVFALGKIGDHRAKDVLEKLSLGDNYDLADAAEKALEQLMT